MLIKTNSNKLLFILLLIALSVISMIISIGVGALNISFSEVIRSIFDSDSKNHLIIYNIRLPRTIIASLVGISLSLSGCILQGVMRNNLASPSTIGVTSGASFVGYITLVAYPSLSYLLPVGTIIGAFLTTFTIYLLAYSKGVSPVRMILSGLAVGALFGAFNDIIKMVYAQRVVNAQGFLIGGLNNASWQELELILPFSIIGIIVIIFLPSRLNILMLGDEVARGLGLKVESFRFFLIIISSLLAGSSVAVIGLVSFVGLIIPHIARLFVGGDYNYLFPASSFLGVIFLTLCDSIGRIIILPAEMPVGVIIAFIGAPFFLYLLRKKKVA